ncbi:DNA-directed RNA polymerase subunit omega [Clostridia bacterium]|nr:DNA-directed RNA polymerase subunit omega [Clostridia bacterium]
MKAPTVDKLLERVPSKYTLVIVAAKRARQLISMPDMDFEHGNKPIMKALEEIASGDVVIKKPE